MATAWKADPGCRGCYYLASTGMGKTCDFFLMTGRRRGCPAGEGCKEYLPRKRDHAARPLRSGAHVKVEKSAGDPPETPKEGQNAPKKRNRPPTKLDEEKAMELYRQGLNDREVGARLGVTHSTVCLWRKRRGLPSIAPKGRRVEDREEELMELYRQGLSDGAIGRAVGFEASVVRRWRLRRGLPATHQRGWPTK